LRRFNDPLINCVFETGDVLAHAALEQLDILWQITDGGGAVLQRQARDLRAVETDLAQLRAQIADQQSRQRRLAGGGWTDHAQRRARFHREADRLQKGAILARITIAGSLYGKAACTSRIRPMSRHATGERPTIEVIEMAQARDTHMWFDAP